MNFVLRLHIPVTPIKCSSPAGMLWKAGVEMTAQELRIKYTVHCTVTYRGVK